MRRLTPLLLLVVLVAGMAYWQQHRQSAPSAAQTFAPGASGSPASLPATEHAPERPAFLPPEAGDTLDLIARGGPFPHRQDGGVFGNRERLLPDRPRGYYHEYTVETPGARDRGARRIITGGNPPVVYYYTDDHYRSFRSFRMDR
jgi:guanyl-specific ribonuclease Sa